MTLRYQLLILSASFLSWTAAGVTAKELGGLLRKNLGSGLVSAEFVRCSDGAKLFSMDPDLSLTPASVTKVVTTAASLALFSPRHTFNTRFYYSGKLRRGEVSGDLIVKGDGDPYIVSERLWQLASDFRHLGIRKFKGGIVIDNSLFGGDVHDASRRGGKKASSNAYDAPVAAFGVNFNTFAIAVSPGEGIGQRARASLDPYPLRSVVLDNRIKTVAKGNSYQAKRTNSNMTTRVALSGKIAKAAGIQKVYRSTAFHAQTSGEYLRAFLGAAGVVVEGKVREGVLPKGAQLLYELDSYPMIKIVEGLNKYSNNYIADVLTKRLGARFPRSGRRDAAGSGTYANGLAVIGSFLRKQVGISTKYTLKDGSGLSTQNRLSASQVTKLLKYMSSRLDLFPEFLASMPAASWDGTMKKRFKSFPKLAGLVRAKTGTLTEPVSVSALAGYINHRKHGLVAFAIIENGRAGKRQPGIDTLRLSQDKLIDSFLRTR